MTRRRNLEQHRHTLNETRDIMNSMKTLAYMETHKLARFLDAQRSVVSHIETLAADFLGFYPETLPSASGSRPVYLLLGSERGFCGDFNESLLAHLESHISGDNIENPQLILAGHKLRVHLEDDTRVVAFIEGASLVEEVEMRLMQIINVLSGLQTQEGRLALKVIHHDLDREQIVIAELLPPFEQLRESTPRFQFPPLLNLPPQRFLVEMVDHYLFAALHKIMYVSLMSENQRRVRHLEGAVQHLEDKSANLLRRCNALRQEEIIEEIEVILLSASSVNPRSTP